MRNLCKFCTYQFVTLTICQCFCDSMCLSFLIAEAVQSLSKSCLAHTAWKCPNTGLFLVRIFPLSDWIRKDTSYLSVFSPNAGKYGPEITSYLDIFHVVRLLGKCKATIRVHFVFQSQQVRNCYYYMIGDALIQNVPFYMALWGVELVFSNFNLTLSLFL